jgi:hypothetical protein
MRRRAVIAGLAASTAAVAAGLYRFTNLLVKHYPPTPYDDVLAHLTDRAQAAKLGAQVAGDFDVKREAAALRATFDGQTLAAAAGGEIATGRMTEVDGWILPRTVVRLAALASRV